MRIGSWVWYSDSLWYEPVRVKVVSIERDVTGRIVWVKSVNCSGDEISDYSNLFSVFKPVVYQDATYMRE